MSSETFVSDLQLIWGLKHGQLFVEYGRSSVRKQMEESASALSRILQRKSSHQLRRLSTETHPSLHLQSIQNTRGFPCSCSIVPFPSAPVFLPPRLISVCSSATGALIMEITYGLNVESHEDKFLQTAERAMAYLERVMVPGAFPVDTFPIRSFGPWLANYSC